MKNIPKRLLFTFLAMILVMSPISMSVVSATDYEHNTLQSYSFNLSGNPRLPIEFRLFATWEVGYEFEWIVTNNTELPILNWVFAFDFNQELKRYWNVGEVIQDGNHLIISAPSWETAIQPGQSVSFGGIVGKTDGAAADSLPFNITLNGTPVDTFGRPNVPYFDGQVLNITTELNRDFGIHMQSPNLNHVRIWNRGHHYLRAQWHFIFNPMTNTYTIQNMDPGLRGQFLAEGANNQLVFVDNITDAAQWRILEMGVGIYVIENTLTGHFLDVEGSVLINGTTVRSMPRDVNAAQLWSFQVR